MTTNNFIEIKKHMQACSRMGITKVVMKYNEYERLSILVCDKQRYFNSTIKYDVFQEINIFGVKIIPESSED